MQKKVIAGLVIVALLGTGGWWFMSRRASTATAKNAPQHVQQPVRRGTIRSEVSGNGPVRSVNGVTVRANQSGAITQILAKDGDRVVAGQPVVVLENKSLVASLTQSQLDVQSARTNLENLLNPLATAVRAQELKVESARATLQQRQDDVANLQVTAPVAGVVASVTAVTGGSVNNNSLLFTLYDDTTPTLIVPLAQESASALKPGDKATVSLPGHGTLQGAVARIGGTATPLSGNRDANVPVAIDLPAVVGIRPGMVGQVAIQVPGLTYAILGSGSVQNDATEVRAKVAGTVEALHAAEGERVGAGDLLLTIENDPLLLQLEQAANDLKTQEQNLTNLLEPAQDPSRQLTTYQQKLQQAQLTLSQRQSDVDDLVVKAPVSGTISALTAIVGDKVSASTNLFRVADYSTMEVTISVDELDVAQIKVGQPAEITLDALPGKTYRGQVTRVNPEGTFRNDIATFEVTVAVERPDGLMAGMNSSVNIVVQERQNVLYLPVAAVRVMQGRAFVNVLEGDQVVRKEVQVGVRTNDRYEITGGLNEGDPVIVATIQPQSGVGPFGGGGFPGGGRNAPGATTTPQGPTGGSRP
ncbi:MAG: efflux RND transporter periplasmic adaptor subunit [Bacillota bacterium]